MPNNLTAFFSSKSIAIVGASRSPKKVGNILIKNIMSSGFDGKIYPINPTAKTILKNKCFKDISEVPEIPDLVIISIPAVFVPEVLEKVGEKGSKNVVVISAGFKESGENGATLERQIQEISNKYEINLLGPNCLGFFSNENKINATFGNVVSRDGKCSFITQSGAIATSIFDWFNSTGVGFSDFITLGNKAVLNESDFLEYFFEKNHGSVTSLVSETSEGGDIHPIGLYLESIVEGSRFLEVSKKITKHDPVFVIKPGKTAAAASAMKSHTGAIAGADDVLDEVLKEAGVIRCDTLEEFFDLSKAFSWSKIPEGPRVAIVSNAGGPAVISSDSIVESGLEMAIISEETKANLLKTLPPSSNISNPVDVLGDALADRFISSLEILLQSNDCESVLILLTPQMMTQVKETAKGISEVSKKYNKPVLCSFIGGEEVEKGEKILNEYNVPSFDFPERAIYAIKSMWDFRRRQLEDEKELDIYQVLNFDILPEEINNIVEKAQESKQKALDNLDADRVISSLGIHTPPTINAYSLEEAKNFSEINGYPVVLKMSSPLLLHKKKFGGVVPNILNEDELVLAWNEMEISREKLDQDIKNNLVFQVQKQVPAGTEIIVGVKNDETFGHFLLFGAGGSLAELISDRNLSLLPLDRERVKNIVSKSKVFKLLGNRKSLDDVYDLVLKLSRLIDCEGIDEVEINPAIILNDSVWAVDTKIKIKESVKKENNTEFKTAHVTNVNRMTNNMYYFDLEMSEPFNILPGQYLSVKVSDKRINCYSVAGFQAPNKFNFLIDISPGGPGSQFFENLKVGNDVTFMGPFGSFVLKPNEGVDDILFFGTGCGFAPLKYMIEEVLSEGKENSNVRLYLGMDDFEDLIFLDYLEDLTKKHANFTYKISLANPHPSWSGETGFVTELLQKDFSDTSKCSAYLCGNPLMVDSVSKILEERGCPLERIYTEKYGK